jgi:hypothetical protein
MTKFRVGVERTEVTLGWVEIEAETAGEAYDLAADTDQWDLEDVAEWGSCGDTREIELTGEVEEIYEPTVSEGLWR